MAARVTVFSPSPLLTITIEAGTDQPEVHLHAGGQGVWVARLAATLGAEVALCCALGGEPGRVLRTVLESDPIDLRAAAAETPNGVYIHDRRSGRRVEVAAVDPRRLGRHASDELYGLALAAGLDADVTMVTGSQPQDVIAADLYRRLVADLRANGETVIADLTGAPLHAVLEAGVDLLRISDEELVTEGYAEGNSRSDVLAGARALHAAGARSVLVSRASRNAVLVSGISGVRVSATAGPPVSDVAGPPVADAAVPAEIELVPPAFEALDHRGAGDSMFAATGVGLARGMGLTEALRLGMAAGALNVTRRGLGTGTRAEIERLAAHVQVRS